MSMKNVAPTKRTINKTWLLGSRKVVDFVGKRRSNGAYHNQKMVLWGPHEVKDFVGKRKSKRSKTLMKTWLLGSRKAADFVGIRRSNGAYEKSPVN